MDISPFAIPVVALLVPIAAIFVPIVAIVGDAWGKAHSARLKADQRMAMLAQGHSLAEIEAALKSEGDVFGNAKSVKDPMRSLGNARRAAVVLISLGVGTIAFFSVVALVIDKHKVFAGAATGLVPLILGLGFVVDYQLQKRELSRFGLELDPDADSPHI